MSHQLEIAQHIQSGAIALALCLIPPAVVFMIWGFFGLDDNRKSSTKKLLYSGCFWAGATVAFVIASSL